MNVLLSILFTASAVTATASFRMRSLDAYCRGGRTGQFAYEPDCHKFVNCGASGLAYLQECPADLLFDPFLGTCNWPQVPGKCRGFPYPSEEPGVVPIASPPKPVYPPSQPAPVIVPIPSPSQPALPPLIPSPPQSMDPIASPPTGNFWSITQTRLLVTKKAICCNSGN